MKRSSVVILVSSAVVVGVIGMMMAAGLVLWATRPTRPGSVGPSAAGYRPPATTEPYLVAPGIYAGAAPTGPLPPPPGPGLMPTGFRSRTFYSVPSVDPALDSTVDVSGANETVGPTGLRVDRVTPGSRLDKVYGLMTGDVIVQHQGVSYDADLPVAVAKAYMLETIGSGNMITVRRGGHTYYLEPDRSPQDVTPGVSQPPLVIDVRKLVGSPTTTR